MGSTKSENRGLDLTGRHPLGSSQIPGMRSPLHTVGAAHPPLRHGAFQPCTGGWALRARVLLEGKQLVSRVLALSISSCLASLGAPHGAQNLESGKGQRECLNIWN